MENNTVNKKMFHIMDAALRLQQKKANDYDDWMQYFPFGDMSFIQMIWVKVARLKNLANKSSTYPFFESKLDSVYDLINYAAMYGAYLKEMQNEANSDDNSDRE